MEVSAGSQKPALVVRQTVAHKEHIVFLARFTKCLSQLCLLVFDWGQYKRRGVKLDWAGPLKSKSKSVSAQSHSMFTTKPIQH